MPEDSVAHIDFSALEKNAISSPLVTHIYTADPSAHVFDGKVYIYPSHDIDEQVAFKDDGAHFQMKDYHVLSMDNIGGKVIDHGVALDLKDVPWAAQQMWAPDIACKEGKYYFYFPAKNKEGIFKIGVAIGDTPVGPFIAQPEAIVESYSIDPATFADDDGAYYMYFGGIWGGQLQKYRNNQYGETNEEPTDYQPALGARIARLSNDMTEFAELPREILIVDDTGKPLLAGDNDRRFFEGAWMHKYNGKYYFSYSTGDTHFICYAIGDNPYGPFKYAGRILNPVVGWTSHHSICEVAGKWYLFYHDSSLSKGITHLRCTKVTAIHYLADGSIETIQPYRNYSL